MKRKNFLRGLGLASMGAALPIEKVKATEFSATSQLAKVRKLTGDPTACILIPSETRGPYPLDLSTNTSMFRTAINETQTGVPLTITFTIVNTNNNCAPLKNVRVDVWACNKDGVYSGYSNNMNAGTVGSTFCRGIQISDANGQATFTTIFPGWYPGRITHIHFEMYLSSVLNATSQAGFDQAITTAVYNSSLYSAHGQNSSVTSFAADNVFSDGTTGQIFTVTGDVTNGYKASLTVGIASTTTGLINVEPETGAQFKLKANYPNPFSDQTTILFTLNNAANVKIDLYDMSGKKVYSLLDKNLGVGEHEVVLKRNAANLSSGSYAYQLTTENENGKYNQVKVLTVI